MDGKFAAFIAKFKEFFGNLSSKAKKLIASSLVLLIIFAAGLAYFLNNKPYEVLFTGLNEQEASDIMGKLQESAVDYQFETNGTLLVPKEQVSKLKAQLAFEGYPKSGFAYDAYTQNISLMTTESEKNNYWLLALQDKIAATIGLFNNVKEAKVTIALGEDRRNVLDSANSSEATASVVVIMQDGGSPTEQQVEGIQRLVARSTPQLEFGNIVVVDGNGADVSVIDDTSQSGASQLKLKVEKEMSEDIRKNILNVLEPIYGSQNLRISVKCSVDVDKKIREIINYSAPPNEADKQGIPGSVSAGNEIIRGGEGAGGIVGTQTNAEVPNYGQIAQPDGTENYFKTQNDINYLVDQIKEQAQIDSAVLEDLTISLAVNGNNLGSVTRADLTTLIANAAGVAIDQQAQKIAIVVAPFYQAPVVPEPPVVDTGLNYWIIIAAGATAVLLFIILLVVILANKKKKKKRQEAMDAEAAAILAGQGGVLTGGESVHQLAGDSEFNIPALQNDILNIQNEKSLELKEKIRQFAEENPEIAAQLIRTWLKGGEHSG